MEPNNNIAVVNDSIKFDSLNQLIKIHLFIKLVENGLSDKFSDRELSILSNLYVFNGIGDKESFTGFTEDCVNRNICESNSVQSVRNVLSKSRQLNIVKRKKCNNWRIADSYLPKIDNDFIAFKYLFTNSK